MSKKYTKAIHAKRVARMLEKSGDPENRCPAAPHFRANKYPDEMWSNSRREVCGICRKFVGLQGRGDCPCHILGCRTAIVRTMIALEEEKGGE